MKKKSGKKSASTSRKVRCDDPLLEQRLQELLGVALRGGAADAKVVTAADVVLDPRVRFKCMIPKCFASGTCAHCPPDGFSYEEVLQTVSRYDKGIFFRVLVKSDTISGAGISECINEGKLDEQGRLINLGAHYILVFQVVALLARKARQWGYEPSGFTAGTCRDVLCHFQSYCQAMMTTRGCRHSDISRPSMESCGMDVYSMGANMGWDIYPIGGTCQPEDIPRGSLMGLVLVA